MKKVCKKKKNLSLSFPDVLLGLRYSHSYYTYPFVEHSKDACEHIPADVSGFHYL